MARKSLAFFGMLAGAFAVPLIDGSSFAAGVNLDLDKVLQDTTCPKGICLLGV